MLIIVIVIYAVIILYEVPKMTRKNLKRELALFSVLMFIGFVLGLLLLSGVKIPSPTREINVFIRNVLKLSYEHFALE